MKLEKNDYRRIYAIPDVHGRLDLLDKALEMMDADGYDDQQDLLVFTGDVIDRGPDSKGVIDLIMALSKDSPNVVFLRGNHEEFAVDYYVRKHPHAQDSWAWNGMYQTLSSYGDGPLCRMTDEHIRFIASSPFSLEVQGFFFSHAPVPREKVRDGKISFDHPDQSSFRGQEYTIHDLTWTYFGPECERRDGLMHKHEGPMSNNGKGPDRLIGICGHIHRGPHFREVRIFPQYRMLDCGSGCFPTGSLAIHECISNRTLYARQEDLRDDMEGCACQTRPIGFQPHADTTCPNYNKMADKMAKESAFNDPDDQ